MSTTRSPILSLNWVAEDELVPTVAPRSNETR